MRNMNISMYNHQSHKSSLQLPLNVRPGNLLDSIAGKLGFLLVFAYLVRASVLSLWVSFIPARIMSNGGYCVLAISFVFLVIDKYKKVSVICVLFIASIFLGVPFSSRLSEALFKWAGLALLIAVVGPLFISERARYFRCAAWQSFKWGFITVGILSTMWYALHLPNLGRGLFTGVMLHSMLLGPMAGMAVLFCAHRAFLKRSITFTSLSILFVIPCVLSGSRIAVLALVFGFIVLVIFYLSRSGLIKTALIIWLTLLIAFLYFAFVEDVMSSKTSSKYMSDLQEKGWTNTRQELWEARWAEFNHSPVVGVGIGTGEGRGTAVDVAGKINVEPGSSYLALLAMTGLAGALGFLSILANIFRSAWMNKSMMMSNASVSLLLAISGFLAVHMIAEGYILAVGSPFCLLFWLCLGRMNDLFNTGIEQITKGF